MSRDPDFEAWIQEARDADLMEVAHRYVPDLKKSGQDWHAACPVCGGKDRNEFAVTPGKNVFLCRKSGEGGDVIKLVQHVLSCEFMTACEEVNRRPPPRSDNTAEPIPVDDGALRERREERRDADLSREDEQAQQKARMMAWVNERLAQARPIFGTQAEAYLRRRSITPAHNILEDLFWIPSLNYRGFADEEAKQEITLGAFPAMLAPIRMVDGSISGLHATYLDLEEPIKLRPPGSLRRNRAKKMFGGKKGGLIRLGPIKPVMAIGEGIETVLSWFQLGLGPDVIGIAAAGDLGNLAGSPTGWAPHPRLRNRKIMNGVPDMEEPGMILPEEIRDVIFIGDGDSDAANTRSVILTAARRQRLLGRNVMVHFAPDGADWNDVETGKWKPQPVDDLEGVAA